MSKAIFSDLVEKQQFLNTLDTDGKDMLEGTGFTMEETVGDQAKKGGIQEIGMKDTYKDSFGDIQELNEIPEENPTSTPTQG